SQSRPHLFRLTRLYAGKSLTGGNIVLSVSRLSYEKYFTSSATNNPEASVFDCIQARKLMKERTIQNDEDRHHGSRARRAPTEGPLRRWQGQTGGLRCLCPSRSPHWKSRLRE